MSEMTKVYRQYSVDCKVWGISKASGAERKAGSRSCRQNSAGEQQKGEWEGDEGLGIWEGVLVDSRHGRARTQRKGSDSGRWALCWDMGGWARALRSHTSAG